MSMKKRTLIFFLLLAFIAGWSLLLAFIGPDAVVETLGVKQGYLFAFLISALGGISTLTITSFYVTLFTLIAGGLDPLFLGLITGVGITFGDSLFYYLGMTGRSVLFGRAEAVVQRFSGWINRKKTWMVQLTVYLYAGFTPLPNDVLSVALALSRISYWTIIIPLVLGNITLMLFVAIGASMGIEWVKRLV